MVFLLLVTMIVATKTISLSHRNHSPTCIRSVIGHSRGVMSGLRLASAITTHRIAAVVTGHCFGLGSVCRAHSTGIGLTGRALANSTGRRTIGTTRTRGSTTLCHARFTFPTSLSLCLSTGRVSTIGSNVACNIMVMACGTAISVVPALGRRRGTRVVT